MRTGYKQTEVGAVPADWDVSPLGRLVTSVEYGSSAKSSTKGSMPVLRMGNLQGGKIDWNDLVYTDDEREIAKYALRPGDVLFNRTNTIDLVGKTSIYCGEEPAIFAGYLIRINAKKDLLDSCFLNYTLNTEFAKKYSLKVLSVAVGQANINGQKLKTYPIPLPPTVGEQSAIAATLNDVDALLSGLDKLIAKKRGLKQAAMQRLLTGKTRLPGFKLKAGTKQTDAGVIPEDWDVSPVGREFDVKLGKMLDAEKNVGDLKPYLGNRSVQWNQIDVSDLQLMRMTRSDMERFRLRKGDLLVCEGGEVGRAALWDEPIEECYYQKALHRLRPLRGFDSRLMVEMLHLWSNAGTLDNYVTQTSIAHLPREKFLEVPMPVPPLSEQSAIAEVLSDMNSDLSLLEARRNKTRLLKQGMMQELLTGKTRLI
nr:restriction endonuclease subunit S [Cupriavidus sp. LEh25]